MKKFSKFSNPGTLLIQTIKRFWVGMLVATLLISALLSTPQYLYKVYREWRYETTIRRMKKIQSALKKYKDKYGKYPSNLFFLKKTKLTYLEDLRDGWEQKFHYQVDHSGIYHLESYGSDGKWGPKDFELKPPFDYTKIDSATDITAPFLSTLHDFEPYNDKFIFIKPEEKETLVSYFLYWGIKDELNSDTKAAIRLYRKGLKMTDNDSKIKARYRNLKKRQRRF